MRDTPGRITARTSARADVYEQNVRCPECKELMYHSRDFEDVMYHCENGRCKLVREHYKVRRVTVVMVKDTEAEEKKRYGHGG